MTAALPPAVEREPNGGEPLVALPVKVIGAVIALATVALIGYGIGTQQGKAGPHVLTGRAYVGDTVGSIMVDGWAYGFDITPNGMQWYEAGGDSHDGGVPPCLQGRPGHYAWIRFGYSVAYGLHGESWRAVDWVQCLTRHA
jgi:hypothetical protein